MPEQTEKTEELMERALAPGAWEAALSAMAGRPGRMG
jgi:hypothetical protein